VNGTATAGQWLVCGGIGCGTGAVVLGLLKLALDTTPAPTPTTDRLPTLQQPSALPALTEHSLRWDDAGCIPAELHPIRVQPSRARHAKKAA